MNFSKVLFLTAILAIGAQCSGITYQEQQQQVFNFAIDLHKQNDTNAKTIANWLEQGIRDNTFYSSDTAIIIINAPLTLEEKIVHLLEFKTNLEKRAAEYKAAQDKQNREWEGLQKKYQLKDNLTKIAAIITFPAVVLVTFASAEFGVAIGKNIAKAVLSA
jgi:hypothetical protein